MPTRKLTDQAVRSLRPDRGQVDYWDTSPKNFGVRVSPAGRKTFIVRYRTAGRYRRMSLGVYPTVSLADARQHARQVLGEVASNDDPAQVRQDARHAPSFEALTALYLEKHARGEEAVVAPGSAGHRERASPEVAHVAGERDPPS